MQTHKEKLLFERCGRQKPFHVPEGYFEEFPQNIMQRINQQKKKRIIFRWISSAAAIIIFASAVTFSLMQTDTNTTQELTAEELYEGYEDELYYSTVSNIDIALFITEAE